MTLSMGGNQATVRPVRDSEPGQIRLASDVWKALAVPYEGLRMHLRQVDAAALQLGPVVAVLYAGQEDSLSERAVTARADYHFGHVRTEPGLWAMGFAKSIDWRHSVMYGYVVDNRPNPAEPVLPARFPMPDAVRLTWSIPRDVITQLRERTGNRTFNWNRNLGKWEFHTRMTGVRKLAQYLPDTRLFRNQVDLAAMLARYDTIFVKYVFGIKGRGSVRIDRSPEGLIARHMVGTEQVESTAATLTELMPQVRQVVGRARSVVQQGLDLTGQEGRALDFRVVTVRTETGGWRCPVVTAKVAPDERLVFTNVANGATEEEALMTLQTHHGMSRREARRCLRRMIALCIRAARVLQEPLHPLGILGFDVVVEPGTGRLWLLEANTVPGFGYSPELDAELARSQVDYARFLAGYLPA